MLSFYNLAFKAPHKVVPVSFPCYARDHPSLNSLNFYLPAALTMPIPEAGVPVLPPTTSSWLASAG